MGKGTEMKKLTVLLLPLALLAISCGTTGQAANVPEAPVAVEDGAGVDANFSEVMHRYWILSQIRTVYETVSLDRANHAELGFGDIFTLRFDDGLVFGMAMPNTYRGPFNAGENQSLTFGLMATTMMAAFMEPEELTEHQFFAHLGNVLRWNLVSGNLELYAIDGAYAEAVLVFVPLEG